MKNLHFCTPKLLEYIKDPKNNYFTTFRTGWSPNIYEGDIININERDDKNNDILICKALVLDVNTIRFSAISDMFKFKGMFPEEEIKRYDKDFHKDHWFFDIRCKKLNKVNDLRKYS